MAYSQENATYYAIRFFYDLLFFASINIVFLNIIFGIIVDTFAELRESKNKMDEDKKTICFICGVDRYTVIFLYLINKNYYFFFNITIIFSTILFFQLIDYFIV